MDLLTERVSKQNCYGIFLLKGTEGGQNNTNNNHKRNRQNENKPNKKKLQNNLKNVDEESSSRSSINVIGTSNQEHSGGDMSIINIIKSIKWSVDL